MSTPPPLKCMNCIFWMKPNGEDRGECRCAPPIFVKTTGEPPHDYRAYPTTNDDDWCGAFRLQWVIEDRHIKVRWNPDTEEWV